MISRNRIVIIACQTGVIKVGGGSGLGLARRSLFALQSAAGVRGSRWCCSLCLLLASLVLVLSIAPAHGQRPSTRRQNSAQVATTDSGGLSPVAKTSLDAAVAALQANALDNAERNARAAVSASPRSAITHNVLGVVLDRSGRSNEALSEFNTALKLDPNLVSARNNLGRLLAEHGKTAEAIAEFERVLKIDPAHAQAHYNLGALYGDSGDFVKAAEHFARAREAEPNDPQLALAFLNVAYRANRVDEANAAADLVERTVTSDGHALFTLATALARNQQYEHAARLYSKVNDIEEFKHAIERDGKNANYHFLLVREYFRAGYWEGAIKEYGEASALDPK